MKVLKVEPRIKPGMAASLIFGWADLPDRDGLYAEIEMGTGTVLHLSKIEGDDVWRVDDAFGPHGEPIYVHGYGSVLSPPAGKNLIAALDEVGMTKMTGVELRDLVTRAGTLFEEVTG